MNLISRFTAWLRCVAAWRLLGASRLDALRLTFAGAQPITGATETTIATGATEAVELWAEQIFIEAAYEIPWTRFMKSDANSIIELKTELSKRQGEKLTYTLIRKLSGTGVANDGTMEGNEENLPPYSDTLTLAQRRNAVRLAGRTSQRRTQYDQRNTAKVQLRTWLAEYISDDIFSQFDTSPTTVIYAGTAAATTDLVATDLFTPYLINRAKVKAVKASPKIHPIVVNGRSCYVCIVASDVEYDMRTNANSGVWNTVMQNAGPRDLVDNPIFSGALAYWDQVFVFSHEKIPTSTTWGSGNIAGASNFFLGRQAGLFAWGAKPEAWTKVFDYNNSEGFCIGAIWAFKKAVFNSNDNGFIALRTARTNV